LEERRKSDADIPVIQFQGLTVRRGRARGLFEDRARRTDLFSPVSLGAGFWLPKLAEGIADADAFLLLIGLCVPKTLSELMT